MSKKTVEIAFVKSLYIGQYPHMPVRFELRSEWRKALGLTEEDEERLSARHAAEAKGKKFEEEFQSSNTGDTIALLNIYSAAIALCLPESALPGLRCTLQDHRNNVVSYGADVYDVLYEMYVPDPGTRKIFRGEIAKLGPKLIREMNAAAFDLLVTEVAAEQVFTKAPEATGTGG